MSTGMQQAASWLPCQLSTPDGYVPCCAESIKSCLPNGACLGANGNLYRGGCTDPTWKSPSCPSFCPEANIYNCGNGTGCCVTGGTVGGQDHCSCQPGAPGALLLNLNTIAPLTASPTSTLPISTSATSNTSSTPGSNTTITSTNTPPEMSLTGKLGLIIGVIGGSLVLLALFGVFFMMRRRVRRRTNHNEKSASELWANNGRNQRENKPNELMDRDPGELPNNHYWPPLPHLPSELHP